MTMDILAQNGSASQEIRGSPTEVSTQFRKPVSVFSRAENRMP